MKSLCIRKRMIRLSLVLLLNGCESNFAVNYFFHKCKTQINIQFHITTNDVYIYLQTDFYQQCLLKVCNMEANVIFPLKTLFHHHTISYKKTNFFFVLFAMKNFNFYSGIKLQ